MKKFFLMLIVSAGVIFGQSLNVTIQPKYIQGINTGNTNRLPYAYFGTISGLTPNAEYRYFNQIVRSTDSPTTSGAGNAIFVRADSPFVRSTGPAMATAGNYGVFTTDATGSYSGWFVNEPTGNARFVPGGYVMFRIMLNDGAGGTSIATRLTSADSAQVLNLASDVDGTAGTGIWSRSTAPAKSFVLLYDNVDGTGRPLAATFAEDDGTVNTTATSYALFYSDSVNAINGAWGTIIPNVNPNGVRRVEARDLNGNLYPHEATDEDGVWGTVNTVNPTGGTTALMLPPELVPLPVELVSFTASVLGSDVTLNWVTASELNNSGFYVERSAAGSWEVLGFVPGSGTKVGITAYSFTDRNLAAGNYTYRLKQTDFDGTVKYSGEVLVEVGAVPTEYSLSQNYPNPFNPSTVIRFTLPVSETVSLVVYNALGEEVAVLASGVFEAGSHSVSFDATALTGGLYIYELKAGAFSSAKKMLLIK